MLNRWSPVFGTNAKHLCSPIALRQNAANPKKRVSGPSKSELVGLLSFIGYPLRNPHQRRASALRFAALSLSLLNTKNYVLYSMKRPMPWNEQVDIISSGESSSSDSETGVQNDGFEFKPSMDDFKIPAKEMTSEDLFIKRAEMYQEYMKQIPIPAHRGSVIPFTTWMGLGKSIKQLYDQPLHYLTNIQLKQWDQVRLGSSDEYKPLDTVIHPSKAEATVWVVEEIHRRTSSHHHVAKLWLSDPMHHAYVDSIFPQL